MTVIRPYLPPSRLARATVRRVPRRGRSPDADAAARRDQAAAIVRDEPAISGAELGRRLGIGPSWGFKLLAEVRATVPDVEAPPPIGPGKVARLRQATIERLAAVTGRPVGEDLDGQAMAAAADLVTARALLHRAADLLTYAGECGGDEVASVTRRGEVLARDICDELTEQERNTAPPRGES